jgi:hypothetical protein
MIADPESYRAHQNRWYLVMLPKTKFWVSILSLLCPSVHDPPNLYLLNLSAEIDIVGKNVPW